MSRLTDPLRKFYHTAIPLPVKYGRGFRKLFKETWQRQFQSTDAINEYRIRRVEALLAYAALHVPYYRRLFREVGFDPASFRSLADLRQIPTLHKDDVIRHHADLRSDEFARLRPIKTVTSATTRDGLVMYRSAHAEAVRRAVVWRHWFNLGYRYRDARVQLTTQLPASESSTVAHDDLNENCRQIDPRAISYPQAAHLYHMIREFRPRMIFAQPSNLAMLVYYWRQRGLEPFEVPIVYLIGEKVYPEYRSLISDFLGGAVHQYYGNRENTASAGDLDDGKLYINADFVHLEFLDSAGKPVMKETGDIVSTGFENHAFPLIRYQTEDVGIDCGYPDSGQVGFPTMEIVGGRGKDLLLAREGLFCPNVISQLKKANFARYRQVQLEQLSLSQVLVRVVPTDDFDSHSDLAAVEKAYRDHLGHMFDIEVRVVSNIPQSDACKNRMVVSELALTELRRFGQDSSLLATKSAAQKQSDRR